MRFYSFSEPLCQKPSATTSKRRWAVSVQVTKFCNSARLTSATVGSVPGAHQASWTWGGTRAVRARCLRGSTSQSSKRTWSIYRSPMKCWGPRSSAGHMFGLFCWIPWSVSDDESWMIPIDLAWLLPVAVLLSLWHGWEQSGKKGAYAYTVMWGGDRCNIICGLKVQTFPKTPSFETIWTLS